MSFTLQNLCGTIHISQRRKLRLENDENFTVLGDYKILDKIPGTNWEIRGQESETWRSKHHVEKQRPSERMEGLFQHIVGPRSVTQLISRKGGFELWSVRQQSPDSYLPHCPICILSLFQRNNRITRASYKNKCHPFKSRFLAGDCSRCH